MIPAILAVVATISVGLPLAVVFYPTASRTMLSGLSYLYGSGAIFLTLLLLSSAGIRWSAPVVAGALLLVAGVAIFAGLRRSARGASMTAPTAVEGKPWHALPFDLLTLTTVVGFALFATLAGLSEWDFWAIWGLKARSFLEIGGIDWKFLESPLNAFSHPDYPLLLPLNFDFVALLSGGWDDRWLGLMFVAFAASLLLLVRSLFLEDLPRGYAALGTLVVASAACSHFIGLAETPLIAFSGAAFLLLRRGIRDDHAESIRNGAILLGLAGCCKNEGLAMIASAAIAFVVVVSPRVRRLIDLWPAIVIPLPWLVMRAVHSIPTDLASGSVGSRALARLPQLPVLLRALASRITYPGFWISLLAAWVVIAIDKAASRRKGSAAAGIVRRADMFVVGAMFVQMFIYVSTYVVTPADVMWHIGTSWSRVSEQVAAPLIYVTVVMLGRMIERGGTMTARSGNEAGSVAGGPSPGRRIG